MVSFTFETTFPDPPLYSIERELGEIRDLPVPVEWARENFKLSSAYSRPGDFRPYKWQETIINAILEYDDVLMAFGTRLGKSLLAEIMVAYVIDNIGMNAMLCYAKRETVEDVFDDRIKPLIQEIPTIRRHWSGQEKDLTRRKIRLRHMFLRVASAEVKADIATFGAGLIYGSEVSKYRIRRGWDPVEALRRRQADYRILNRHKAIFESSPIQERDCLHQEIMQSGVRRVRPRIQCPKCGIWQVMTDSQVKEIANSKGEKDHDPDRIRTENAAFYECIGCKETIPEADRPALLEKMVWAADEEKILPNGEIENKIKAKSVAFIDGNRFLDLSFTFAECLARLFAAQRKGREALQLYENEDMARFWREKSKRISADYLETKKAPEYRQSIAADIPNEVLILLLGADMQDNGIYFVVNGYGRGLQKYLVRAAFVKSPIGESTDPASGMSKDPRQLVYERFVSAVWAIPFERKDGRKLDILHGFIDRGGHRPDDVDYISQMLPQIQPYIGATRPDYKRPMVELSANGRHYMGQSQRLSEEVTKIIDSSTFHIPRDTPEDYMQQVLNEYIEDTIDTHGNKKRTYVKKEPNHFRSCENYSLASVYVNNLKELLFDISSVEELERSIQVQESEPGKTDPEDGGSDESEYLSRMRF